MDNESHRAIRTELMSRARESEIKVKDTPVEKR